ncbi:MAG: radical SAM protein [Bacteroidota bacterium]
MIFSRFNFLFKNEFDEKFVYNSLTNSLLEVSSDLYFKLKSLSTNHDKTIEPNFERNTLKTLIDHKVLVREHDDERFILQKKYLDYLKSFKNDFLSLVIAPTLKCNFVCPYCYEDGDVSSMNYSILDQLISYIHSIRNIDRLSICWHGGEPLLAFDKILYFLDKLYSKFPELLINHSMVTNGYLLCNEKMEKLMKFSLNYIQITIDGTPEHHNRNRPHKSGMPTYDRIIYHIDNILQNWPSCFVNVRVNIHKNNCSSFSETYKSLTNRWKGMNCRISLVFVSDNDNCRVPCMKLHDRFRFFKELSKDTDLQQINFFPEKQEYGCTATYLNSLVVGPEGELYKCWADVGNQDKVIGSILNGVSNIDLVSEYMIGSSMYSDESCLKCFLLPVCNGVCNLVRFENKFRSEKMENCPIDINNLAEMLSLHHKQTKNK